MKTIVLSLLAIALTAAVCSITPRHNAGRSLQPIACSIKPLPASARHHAGAAPHIRIREGTSLNWSGYAAVAGSLASPQVNAVTEVTGQWKVPSVTGSAGQYSALWVGIDGYADGTVEQLGTEQDVVSARRGRTTVQNYTWFEMYPAGSYEIVGFPTDPGDVIGAGVSYAGSGVFTLAITNITRGEYYVVPASYTASPSAGRSSAEWVAEAPSSGRGVLPLADFGTVTFTECSATINGFTRTISQFTNDPLSMETSRGAVKAAPSALEAGGSTFSVTWHHD